MMVYRLVSSWSAEVCQKPASSFLLKLGLMMVQKVQKESIIEFNGQKTLYPIHLESNPLFPRVVSDLSIAVGF